HPDRLHFTLHAGGVHWLPDFGTGSYVSPDLFWYRSTLSHNAPRLDGTSQEYLPARCDCFDAKNDWAWASGRFGDLRRVLVSGPRYVIDVLELSGRVDRLVELPWHFTGPGDVTTPGRWETGELADEFVTRVEQFKPDVPGPLTLRFTTDHAPLTTHLVFDGHLLRAEGPGRPTTGHRETFYLQRAGGRNLRLVAVLDTGDDVRSVRVAGDVIEIDTAAGTERHRMGSDGWDAETTAGRVSLRGARAAEVAFRGFIELEPVTPPTAAALRIDAAPALDGTLAGFDLVEPLTLDLEDQYRRAEEPYAGPDELSATAHINWDDRALYLAVEVTKPDLVFRPANGPPLRLDNEPDDIHSDGIQLYVRGEDEGAPVVGFLVVPDSASSALRVRTVSDATGDAAQVRGAWRRTAAGYCVTLALPLSLVGRAHIGARLGFDLLVNEMLLGRERRAGQLVWSGGNGWVWIRGDRQDPDRFGVLELVG
ncbi:MAG TPA: sugar-binding protein, partial [Gemmatimonadales bacterium]